MKKRIEWVDTLKFICIFFVLNTHLDFSTRLLKTFFIPFYLMGFLFASGYCYSNRGSFAAMLKKKTHQLLIPSIHFYPTNSDLSLRIPSSRSDRAGSCRAAPD